MAPTPELGLAGPADLATARNRRDSFELVWRTDATRLCRLATTLVDDADEAAELVQDAFASAWGRWSTIDDHGGYLTRAVVNRGIDVQRRRARRRRRANGPGPTPEHQPGPTESLLMLVDGLAPTAKAVVVLRYGEDLQLADIARLLELPLGTVKSLVHRSLRTLAEELS